MGVQVGRDVAGYAEERPGLRRAGPAWARHQTFKGLSHGAGLDSGEPLRGRPRPRRLFGNGMGALEGHMGPVPEGVCLEAEGKGFPYVQEGLE